MLRRAFAIGTATVGGLAALHRPADMHCQVPCGIYNEQLRLDAMSEDAQTVRQRSPVLSVLLHPRRTAALTTSCPLRAPFR